MNLDIAESKLFGAHPCDLEKPCAPSELPIETLAYQIRDLAMILTKLTASIETRL